MYPIDLPAQVMLLPCLGANAKLFERQQAVFRRHVITPQWIEPRTNESVRDYAGRWAEQIRPTIDVNRPLLIGGVSLGGVMALEMAQALDAKAVVLISSVRRDSAIPFHSRVVEAGLRILPTRALGKALPWLAVPFSIVDQLDDDELRLLREMVREADPALVKWGAHAMMDWESDGQNQVPIHQIHGKKDWILPPNADSDRVVPDGGHMINLSHPNTVNQFIIDSLRAHVDAEATPVV